MVNAIARPVLSSIMSPDAGREILTRIALQ